MAIIGFVHPAQYYKCFVYAFLQKSVQDVWVFAKSAYFCIVQIKQLNGRILIN